MSTPPPRRPLSSSLNTTPRTNSTTSSSMARSMNPTAPTMGQGLARNPSLRGRAVRKPPIRGSMGLEEEPAEVDSNDTNSQLIADLKEQVERAEQASEQYRRQLDFLQQRLDEATDQQTAAEERDFAARTQIDKLLAEVRDNARQKREMEITFESERNLLAQEKDRYSEKETELQSRVHRLSQSLQARSLERASTARINQSSEEDLQSPTQSSSNHEEFLQVLQDKDAVIDTLKLELADFHIKVAEHEHMGDGRLQTLEKQISDIKMENARLIEENDSFQMLLGEKTLKGDLLHDTHSESGGMSSLAEELESLGENDEVSIEQYRKLEAELNKVKEEKKALNIYIDKIIGRLLQHEGFEHIITGKSPAGDDLPPPPPPKPARKERPPSLTPVAPASAVPPAPETPTMMGGFLQRARSVVARGAPGRPARPMSFMQAGPTANENPETAPSIPINKSHRRARSDQMQDVGTVIQQPNRGSPVKGSSGSPMGSGPPPLARAQTSYFAPPARSDTVRAPSQGEGRDPESSANSITSDQSIERQSTEATSAQASTHTRDQRDSSAGLPVTAGVIKQNQLRPLRLVQNQDAEDEARKKANRQSWMGNWFNKTSLEAHQ